MVTFTKSFLMDELDLPYSALEDDIVDTSRWSENHDIIFEHEGKFYNTGYSCGLTEQQDESPWEYEDEIECVEVHQVERLIKVWEPV